MPMQETFNLLRSQYHTLKSRLITKYGRPDTEEEGFRDYEPSSDYGRMRELREGNAKIQMFYVDTKNSIKANNSVLDDL